MQLRLFLAIFAFTRLVDAATADHFSRWSTEPLEWTTPRNVSILSFGKRKADHHLEWPAARPLLLRVYEGEQCSQANSDHDIPLWWAEIRRHVATEEALVLGQIEVNDLPAPLTRDAVKLQPSRECQSSLVFIPVGSDGTDYKVSPKVEGGQKDKMRAFVEWTKELLRVKCNVVNTLSIPLVLYWVDDSTEEIRVCDLPHSQSVPQRSFLGHLFIVREQETGRLVDWWAMDGAPIYRVEDRAAHVEKMCNADGECPTAEEVMFKFLYDASFNKRHALNTVQPAIAHNYTSMGFLKRRIPESTYKWMKEWYEDNVHAEVKETSAGAVGTQHEAPWYVRHLPPHLKRKLASELLPYLSEWSGFEANHLKLTSIYGSVLRMHVDTMMTHVVSVIMNVDQVDIDSDWVLEIKNHDGQYGYVTMEPGDMLFYESANACTVVLNRLMVTPTRISSCISNPMRMHCGPTVGTNSAVSFSGERVSQTTLRAPSSGVMSGGVKGPL